MKIPKKNGGRFKSMNYSFLVEFGLLFDNETIDGQLFDICILEKSRQIFTNTSTSNPFLCAADFFLQLGSCKEAVR